MSTIITAPDIRAELISAGVLEPRHDFTEAAADTDDLVPCLRLDSVGRAAAARKLTAGQLDRILARQAHASFRYWCARGCPQPEEIFHKRRRGAA